MAAAPNFPTYKWWETDDKTKRLYTELLAEKLSTPRKTPGSSLSRKPSNGKDLGARLTSSPKRDTASAKVNSSEREVIKNKEEKGEEDNKHGKYTFETITIDTLAKYEYIKSPQKRAATTLPVSFFEQTNKAAGQRTGGKDNTEYRDKSSHLQVPPDIPPDTTFSNGHFLISQKLNTAKSDLQELKSEAGEIEKDNKGDATKKVKSSRAMKLKEIPEYSSSESSESSADETVLLGTANTKEEKKSQPLHPETKEASRTKQVCKTDQPLKIEELSSKFQLLSEEVAQLEFKMFEFSDDLQKLKQHMGFKDADTKDKKEDKSSTVEKKSECGVSHQKSFTFADKFHSKAMLMKQQASPSKMLAAKPGNFYPGKITLECSSKEHAMAELKKNDALSEIISKIKEQELSEDDIQEILHCAKDKYIDKPNYLEELGYGRKND